MCYQKRKYSNPGLKTTPKAMCYENGVELGVE